MKTISGDLIQLAKTGEFDLIVHGCNCMCTMGAGIAKGIKAAFPEAFEADRRTTRGDRGKLGTCSYATIDVVGNALTVVNAYTQYDYKGPLPRVDYDAIRSCFRWLRQNHGTKGVGLPRIGAGLAGGDWSKIAAIIDEETAKMDVTLVEFAG
jgi:O-acetyl-ADP-ribose deacetylase (regulator of RNase III)